MCMTQNGTLRVDDDDANQQNKTNAPVRKKESSRIKPSSDSERPKNISKSRNDESFPI